MSTSETSGPTPALPRNARVDCAEELLRHIRTGAEISPAHLEPLLGARARSLTSQDLLCIRGHLLALNSSVDTATRLLSNEPMLSAAIRSRKVIADRLFDCLKRRTT